MSDRLRLTTDGRVARLALDRPDKRNAIDLAMWEAIPALVDTAVRAPEIRLLIVESAAPAMFSAGADIDELARGIADPGWRVRHRAAIRAALRALARAPKPTLAAIDGDCFGGGCGVALACDMRIASTRARFAIPPAKLGLVYPLQETALLVELVGPGQARRMLFSADTISAAEALALGLVEQVTAVESLDTEVLRLGQAITRNSPFSVAAMKALIGRVRQDGGDDDAESAALFDAAFSGADFAEGVAAFRARRRPEFADR